MSDPGPSRCEWSHQVNPTNELAYLDTDSEIVNILAKLSVPILKLDMGTWMESDHHACSDPIVVKPGPSPNSPTSRKDDG